MQITSNLIFCKRFGTSCFILPKIFKKPKILGKIESFTEKWLEHNSALGITSYLSIVLSEILSHSKTIKKAKKLSVFGKNGSRRVSNFLQTHNFWKFDHIFRTYNQNNDRKIWITKVTIIFIMMAQVLFRTFFFLKRPATECPWVTREHSQQY